MTTWLYKRTEPTLWTVGFYDPNGRWEPESDHGSSGAAAQRVHWLNGGKPDNNDDTKDGSGRIVKNLTGRATTAGWTLPEGFMVKGWYEPDDDLSEPRDKGDVYRTDVDEDDYANPTRAFCKHCGEWIRKLDQAGADAVNKLFPVVVDPEEDNPVGQPGDWVIDTAGLKCPEVDGGHEPDEPLAVRWWREDRWAFVGVRVEVVDDSGRQWGLADLWSVELGTFPYRIDRETGAVESVELNPLVDGTDPVPDLIEEALGQAQKALALAQAGPVIDRWKGEVGEDEGE